MAADVGCRPIAGRRLSGAMVSEKRVTRATLLLVDRAAARLGARVALADEFRICGESDDVEQAIRLAKALQPDVCLIGRDVAGHDLASVSEICHAAPACAVVVLSEERDVEDMLAAVRAGAVGYVPGALEGDRLRRIVAAAVNDEAIVPRTMVHELLLELRAGGAGADALTARESQVLGMLRRGQSTACDRRATPDHAGHRAPAHIGAGSEAGRRGPVGADQQRSAGTRRRSRRRTHARRRRSHPYLSAVQPSEVRLRRRRLVFGSTFARTRGRTTWQQQ